MAKVNLTGMTVEALLSLRDQVDKRLVELRAELEKQLAALEPKGRMGSSLRGKKVPPKYRSAKGETWAGRGAKPRWLVDAIKGGKKLDDFLIDRGWKKRRSKR
jgi:DNA-binding protein H-NS